MELRDDDLTNLERHGAEPLPATNDQGYVGHEGARIWYATFGAGHSVIMLHGGLGHSGNWGYQVPGLMSFGYRVVLSDSPAKVGRDRSRLPLPIRCDGRCGSQGLTLGWSKGRVRQSGAIWNNLPRPKLPPNRGDCRPHAYED